MRTLREVRHMGREEWVMNHSPHTQAGVGGLKEGEGEEVGGDRRAIDFCGDEEGECDILLIGSVLLVVAGGLVKT